VAFFGQYNREEKRRDSRYALASMTKIRALVVFIL
jgi:hypothetical protein